MSIAAVSSFLIFNIAKLLSLIFNITKLKSLLPYSVSHPLAKALSADALITGTAKKISKSMQRGGNVVEFQVDKKLSKFHN